MIQPAIGDLLRVKILFVLRIFKLDDTRKHENHIPPFIHDGRMAVRAAHLDWQLVMRALRRRVVEGEALGPVLKVQVFLVKYGSPLKRRPYT